MMRLADIQSPAHIKHCSTRELEKIAEEVRQFLIENL
jgi:deoxyxylulose-5-phosphate synthase